MPGMGTGLTTNNPTIVAAFHAALLHQGLVVLLMITIIGIPYGIRKFVDWQFGQQEVLCSGMGVAVAALQLAAAERRAEGHQQRQKPTGLQGQDRHVAESVHDASNAEGHDPAATARGCERRSFDALRHALLPPCLWSLDLVLGLGSCRMDTMGAAWTCHPGR